MYSFLPDFLKLLMFYSTILKATGLTVHGRSTGLSGIIPKISKEAAIQNALQRLFCMVAGCTVALWIALWISWNSLQL